MKKSTYLIGLALGASTLTFAQVGIGTSTPSSPLDIEATDAAIDINNTAADGDPALNFQLSGATTFSIGIDDGDSDKLKIGTTAPDASTSVTIDGSGNVGIGNTSPTAKLDVDGSAIFNKSGAAVDFRVEGDTEANLLFVDGSADRVGIGTATPEDIFHVANFAGFTLGSALIPDAGKIYTTYEGVSPYLNFSENGDPVYIRGISADTAHIVFYNGNVGIGDYMTTPTSMLEIRNTDATANAVEDICTITKKTSGTAAAGIGAGLIFKIEDLGGTEEQARINVELEDVTNAAEDATMTFDINQAGTMTEIMRIDGTSGYVGIGTTVPSYKLDIDSDDNEGIRLGPNDTYGRSLLLGGWDEVDFSEARIQTSNGNLHLDCKSGQEIYINNYVAGNVVLATGGGNVGIGTTSPTATLDVDGSAIFNESGASVDFRVEGNTDANLLFVDGSADKIGIGTASPLGILHVEGTDTDGEVLLRIGSGRRWDFVQSGTGVGTILALRPQTDGKTFKIVSQDESDLATFSANNTNSSQSIYFVPDGGRVGVGTSGPGYTLDVGGDLNYSGSLTNISDKRFKKDIVKIENALGLINEIDGYHYNFRVEEFPEQKLDSIPQIGFIAQELKEVLPQLVSQNDSGYYSVNYVKVVPVLVMAMKEQQAIIEAQKAEIESLKAEASSATSSSEENTQKLDANTSEIEALKAQVQQMLQLLQQQESVSVVK